MKAWIVENFKDATTPWQKDESFWHSFVRRGKGQLSLMFFMIAVEVTVVLTILAVIHLVEAVFLIAYKAKWFGWSKR